METLILSLSIVNLIFLIATGNTLCKANEELKKELENLKNNGKLGRMSGRMYK